MKKDEEVVTPAQQPSSRGCVAVELSGGGYAASILALLALTIHIVLLQFKSSAESLRLTEEKLRRVGFILGYSKGEIGQRMSERRVRPGKGRRSRYV